MNKESLEQADKELHRFLRRGVLFATLIPVIYVVGLYIK